MTAAVFVDTNVLVYSRDARDVTKQTLAAQWLQTLWRDQNGRTSMQVLNEYYSTVTRKLTPRLAPEDAWEDVQSLFAWEPQATDAALLRLARDIERRYRISWWDALIVGAAQLQQCSLLLTEDLQDGTTFGTVTVKNPFRLKISEPLAAYDVTVATVSRHPRRGRPPRASRL